MSGNMPCYPPRYTVDPKTVGGVGSVCGYTFFVPVWAGPYQKHGRALIKSKTSFYLFYLFTPKIDFVIDNSNMV